MTEIIFGMASAWQPGVWLDDQSAETSDPSIVMQLLANWQEDLTQEELWGVLTTDNLTEVSGNGRQLSPQVRCV